MSELKKTLLDNALTDEQLDQVSGGAHMPFPTKENNAKGFHFCDAKNSGFNKEKHPDMSPSKSY